MAKTQAEIQKVSDERRGVKSKSYKLSLEVIEQITQFAETHGIPQNQLIADAVDMYIQQHNKKRQ